MPNRQRGRVFVRDRRPSLTNWGRSVAVSFTTIAPGAKTLILAFANLAGINETVRRTRGVLSVRSDQSVAPEAQLGALGMVVVNDLAIAAGAASIPGPVTDASDDGWFVWVPFAQSGKFSSVSNFGGERYVIDSKAMRKVEEGFQVAVMVENASASDGLEVACAISLLASRR